MQLPTATPDTVRQSELAAEVARDLAARPKRLQSKYLYDALGSQLFEAICELPWYKITRAEHRLLRTHADAIVTRLRDDACVIELGGGSGQKLSVILEAAARWSLAFRVHLVDISSAALDRSVRFLRSLPRMAITTHQAIYDVGLQRAVTDRPAGRPVLVLFLGSNIGNLPPAAANAFLREIRRALAPGDFFLLGADLTKPAADLLLAYDDPLGVTAAFNKNLLVRLNRELGADFDLDRFAHRAVWNREDSRVECHLVSLQAQRVSIPGAGCTVAFADGESIWTESSYKYEADQIVRMGAAAGLESVGQWVEPSARFALTLFGIA